MERKATFEDFFGHRQEDEENNDHLKKGEQRRNVEYGAKKFIKP